MHGDKLGAVGEGRLDLHVVNHFGDAFHDLIPGQHRRAGLHEFGHAPPVARAFDDEIGNEGNRLGVIELYPALQTPTRHHGGRRDEQLVLLTRREIHACLLIGQASTVPQARHCGPGDLMDDRGEILHQISAVR